MKRTTISLPEDLADWLDYQARVQRVSVAEVIRRTLQAEYDKPREVGFIGIMDSGETNLSERIEEILADEWADYIEKDSFNP